MQVRYQAALHDEIKIYYSCDEAGFNQEAHEFQIIPDEEAAICKRHFLKDY